VLAIKSVENKIDATECKEYIIISISDLLTNLNEKERSEKK
jgi:hypothetical protein